MKLLLSKPHKLFAGPLFIFPVALFAQVEEEVEFDAFIMFSALFITN
jgi:hypothetical protein